MTHKIDNQKNIIENFHTDITEEVNEDYNPYPKPEGSTMTAQYSCIKRNRETRPDWAWDGERKIGTLRDNKRKSYLVGPQEHQRSE